MSEEHALVLIAGDELIGEGDMPRTVPIAFSSYAGMDIGRDNGLVVDRDYEDKAPYPFTGTVKEVVFDLKPAHHEAEMALHAHAAIQAVGQGGPGTKWLGSAGAVTGVPGGGNSTWACFHPSLTVAPLSTARTAAACWAVVAVTAEPSGICTTRLGSPPTLAGTAAGGAGCVLGCG